MRILIYGNSGSGKSTLATRLARAHGLVHLDLDRIVWVAGEVAVQRPAAEVAADLAGFIAEHRRWVIEGCYGELVAAASRHCSELVFLDPGREACQANNRQRPWEPHKYASAAAQEAMLANLQQWVADYYLREDDWSWRAHRRLFDAFAGAKRVCHSADQWPGPLA